MVNKVILIGNAGKDPEMKYLDNGTAMAKFTLATNEVYKKDGEKVTHTEWHNIVLWSQLAEIAEKYIQKGKQIYIEGRIRTRSYEDKNGVNKTITEIRGDNIQLLGRKGDTAPGQGSSQSYPSNNTQQPTANNGSSEADFNQQSYNAEEDNDDLPF